MAGPLSGLPERDRVDVLEAVAALRASGEPLPLESLRALANAGLREVVEAVLARAGRTLVQHPRQRLAMGYSDETADALARRGIGILESTDRAVLCLALIHCVAAPRARGVRHDCHLDGWDDGERVATSQIVRSYRGRGLTREAIELGISRLKGLGLLRAGNDVAPGPALARLTPRRRSELWEDLVLICAAGSARAQFIAARRAEQPAA